MNLFAPPAGPACVVWRWPGPRVPSWVEQTVLLLNRGDDVQCRIAPAGTCGSAAAATEPTPAALQRCLYLHPADLPATAAAGAPNHTQDAAQTTAWLLTDGLGQPLAALRPLLEAITAGQGIELVLWEHSALTMASPAAMPPPPAGWSCVRRLHVRASPHYGRGVLRLVPALAQLLRQACLDRRLKVPLAPATLGLNLTNTQSLDPQRPPKSPAALSLVRGALCLGRGALRAWTQQQQSRWTRERWLIGVLDLPVHQLLGSNQRPAVRWLKPPPGLGYWADPMGHGRREHEIVCEYFDERSGLGHIERLAVDPQGEVQGRTRLVIGAGGHVSFPLMVTLDGRELGMAETSSQRECVLHEIDAAGHWRPIATLLRGVAVADPALFSWGGRYWLAYTDIDRGETDNLCLQYAYKLEGPWQPHANNPVKLDVTSSRMAGGFFVHEGALYRPAQNCLTTYGASVVVHRVLHCSPTMYEEAAVQQLLPDANSPCPDGLHTLSAWGERTLVDGKQHLFSATLLSLKLWRRLRGLATIKQRPVAGTRALGRESSW